MSRLPVEFAGLKGQAVTVPVYDRVSSLGYQVEHRTGTVAHVWRRDGSPFVSVDLDGRRSTYALADVLRWDDLCRAPDVSRTASLEIDVPGDANASGLLLQKVAASVADLAQILAADSAFMSADYDDDAPPTPGEIWDFARAAWVYGCASRSWHGCKFTLRTFAD